MHWGKSKTNEQMAASPTSEWYHIQGHNGNFKSPSAETLKVFKIKISSKVIAKAY